MPPLNPWRTSGVDDSRSSTNANAVALAVPEIRDYHAVNAEIVRHLDRGCRMIRLIGVRGQRLMIAGLAGSWEATIAVEGDAGPELAAGLDAPALTVVCLGHVADGGASGLRAGRMLVLGDVGTAFGYAQRGGLAVAVGGAGPRGTEPGRGRPRPPGDRRPTGGRASVGRPALRFADRIGPHSGRGRRCGRFIDLGPAGSLEQDLRPRRSERHTRAGSTVALPAPGDLRPRWR